MTVEQLRRSGNRVSVEHFRYADGYEHEGLYRATRRDNLTVQPAILPCETATKGGKTRVTITRPDGSELVGVALCSRKDNYNKKLGVRIAIGRALS